MDTHCLHVEYAPDPMDCAAPAVGAVNDTPLCEQHLAFWQWWEASEQ